MQCPVDNQTLMMTERNGVEIDYCPKCRGVWLDRGELDKILERSSQPPQQAAQFIPQREQRETRREEYDVSQDRRRKDEDEYKHRDGKPKKRESFLSELFDF
ncbi:zf-TFIIB domain-containing protein [Pseudochelatococcus contaminans]|nr:zf-TFIIB domain-containing protein [Pseudochelatococcus contaminans]